MTDTSHITSPVVPPGLIDALRNYRQCDEEGVECIASREAVETAARLLAALAAPTAEQQPVAEIASDHESFGCRWIGDVPRDGTKLYSAPTAEPARPDLLERLSYHALERDDMTIDELLSVLGPDGYKKVRGRTARQLELQLLALLAGAPAAEPAHDAALNYAHMLACAIHFKHYREVEQWKPLPDLLGLLTQIDNMASGLVRVPTAEPALTFEALRRANVARCLKWHPAGIESWSPSDWLTAVTGELGELASLLKMRNRERDGLPGNKFSPTQKQIADEIADVATYLDLLAEVLGVNLGVAVAEKFNEVSERVGFPDRIAAAKGRP